ncbi:MAG: TonB-dependent receptor [Vicinamibacterales bacterium]
MPIARSRPTCGHAARALLITLASVSGASAQQDPRVTLPTVVVTAQKEPTDIRDVPGSVTAVTDDTIEAAGVRIVSDAALFAPNTFFTEFTARKSSNPRFRGLGASPANPAVTTYIDGVPQLNVNSSSIELLDVSQIEFVRGPQSPLYGRNALGGIINVTSARPSLTAWTGTIVAPFGNANAREVRGAVSGPLGDTVAVGFSLGRQARDGYTTNDVTGNDLDSRSATFGKAQLMWVPQQNWEARVLVSAERDRDGDYGLVDLGLARSQPFHVQRDFEGYTHRDVRSTTVMLRGEGDRVTFTSSTGFVSWQTEDATDLDYSPLPLATRNNREEALQFTQEIRAASPMNAPLPLTDTIALKWQAGVMLFTQGYDQVAANTLSPFVLSPFIDFPVRQVSPEAALDDLGVGLFGQATFTIASVVDLTVGGRFDRENKEAMLRSYLDPALAPEAVVNDERSYSNTSPQVAVSYRPHAEVMDYSSVSQGFKAGGWNPASLPGSEAYDEERAWHFETGVKAGFGGGRVSAAAAFFHVGWDDLQLNVPNPFVPGQFYIANVGRAKSWAWNSSWPRVLPGVVFGNQYTGLRRGQHVERRGRSSDNPIPNTPLLHRRLRRARRSHPHRRGVIDLRSGRSRVLRRSGMHDDLNTASQDVTPW